jgi:hypothetical protein
MQLVSSPSSLRSVFPRITKHAIRLTQKLARTLNQFHLGLRDGADLMSRYEALARLSDDALAKRGLARGEIVRAALDDPTRANSRDCP